MKPHSRSQIIAAFVLTFLVFAATSLHAVTWTSISDPNAVKGTIAEDINTNGVIVGYYFDGQFDASGFLYSNGVFTTFSYPGQQSTFCMGINDLGQIVGEYATSSDSHGFFFDGTNFQTVEPSGSIASYVAKINNNGQMVGYYLDQSRTEHTFEYDINTGIYTTLQPPQTATLYPGGINNLDEITGFAVPPTGNGDGYFESGGSYKFLSIPNTVTTASLDINDTDEIVGYVISRQAQHKGFLFIHGNSLILAYPGTTGNTEAYGVNNAGDVVGMYVDSGNIQQGFLRTP